MWEGLYVRRFPFVSEAPSKLLFTAAPSGSLSDFMTLPSEPAKILGIEGLVMTVLT